MNLELDLQLDRRDFHLRVSCDIPCPTAGIFGHSGSGKSTLLKAIAGIERGVRGRVALGGDVLFDSSRRIDVPVHKRRIGLVFQDDRLFPHLRVEQNLRFGQTQGKTGDFDTVVETLHLRPLVGRFPENLSGGEKRRVALGRAILASPRILLLDEPMNGLDVRLRSEVLGYLRNIHERFHLPMLIVSHNMEEIQSLSDHLLVLNQGQSLGWGSCSDLALNPSIVESVGLRAFSNVLTLSPEQELPGQDFWLCRPVLETESRSELTGGNRLPLLKVPRMHPASETPFHVILQPRDIVLSPHPLVGVSIQNQIAARIERLVESSETVLCLLDAGIRLFAELSVDAFQRMRLYPGCPVWCLFKSEALRPA